jgi:DNA helicase MCM8
MLHLFRVKSYNYISQSLTTFCSRSKTVNENLKMNAALLSRFDLVFILLDKPDELMDQRLSEHIMAVSSCFIFSMNA